VSVGRLFALHRFAAVLMKEFVQMRRDRLTFAMMIGVPVMQLVLFGYAINMDPKALPAAVVIAESSPFSRSLVRALENTGYFKVVATPASVDAAGRWDRVNQPLPRHLRRQVVRHPPRLSGRLAFAAGLG